MTDVPTQNSIQSRYPDLNIPVPDPSYLTTDQLRREIGALREILETRLDAIDKATSLFQDNLKRVPDDIDKQVGQLRTVNEVRFSSIEKELNKSLENLTNNYSHTLSEMDLRYQQRYDASDKALAAASLAAKDAVTAALAAAKEAVQAASISAEKSTAAAFAASEKAIDKAEAAQHSHNLSQNEWRATINDLIKTVGERARADSENMVGSLRANTDISIRGLTDKTDSAIARLDKTDGRGSQASSTQGTMISVVAILISLAMAGITIFSTISGSKSPDITVAPPVRLDAPR